MISVIQNIQLVWHIY